MELNNSLEEVYRLRSADWQDAISIQRLLNSHALINRFLDWRDPIQWLGFQPYLLLEKKHILQAVMAAPVDPPGISWVRLFACNWETAPRYAWQRLCQESIQRLTKENTLCRCYILALENWIESLLIQNGYHKYQEIIILEHKLDTRIIPQPIGHIKIRPMYYSDLPAVGIIDAASFEDLWVYSLQTLEMAYKQSDISYLVTAETKPVGYLLSSMSGDLAHLTRIAVLPEFTRQHIGTVLVKTLFMDLTSRGITRITLNTQSNNQASLALYDTMGFRRTGEIFGVYKIL